MEDNSRNFYKYLVLLFILSSAVILLLQYTAPQLLNQYVWYIQLYFVAVTAGTYWFTVKGIKKGMLDLQNHYMATTTVRLLVSAALIFVYIYYVKAGKVSFVFNFFALYLYYTIFEIRSVLTNLRAHLKNDGKQ